MSLPKLDDEYWNERYLTNATGWDIGHASPSFLSFFKDIDRNSKILIPGCGNSYEGEVLYKMGFKNLTLLDFAKSSKDNFLKRFPTFPAENFVVGDFFSLGGKYDFILEQTFFCAINPQLREAYLSKMTELMTETGKLVGLLFDAPLNDAHPPFGGSQNEYEMLFQKYFKNVKMDKCQESIEPRAGKELWIEVSNPL